MTQGPDFPAAEPAPTPPRRLRQSREDSKVRALALLGGSGFAVSQPLLEMIRRYPEFVAAHGLRGGLDLLGLSAAILVGPGALVAITGWAISRAVPRASRPVFVGLLGVLLVATLFPPLRRLLGSPLPGLLAATIAAVLILAAEHRFRAARIALAWSSGALPVFLLIFLVAPSIRGMTRQVPQTWTAPPIPPTPVVIVVLDELSLASVLTEDLVFDRDLVPHLSALRDRSWWFRNASTGSGETVVALPAIANGSQPVDGEPSAGTIFQLFRDSHDLVVAEPRTSRHPGNLQQLHRRRQSRALDTLVRDLGVLYLNTLLPPNWRGSVARVDRDWRDFGEGRRDAPTRVVEFERYLTAATGRGPATLYFLHTMFPHAPYTHHPSGRPYRLGGFEPFLHEGVWPQDPDAAADALRRHLLQVSYADRLLGEFLGLLRAEGQLDEALVVVTADHGSSFTAGGLHRRVDAANACEIAAVPLLIKEPGQRDARTSDVPARLVDILPTVADILGFAVPWTTDGSSLLRPREVAGPRSIQGEGQQIPLDADLGHCVAATVRARTLALREAGIHRRARDHPDRGRHRREFELRPGLGEVTLNRRAESAQITAGDRWIPSYISGSLKLPPGAEAPAALLVTVDDVVLTSAVLIDLDDPRWKDFAALLDEGDLEPGPHRVEVWGVTAQAGVLLRP